MQISNMGLWALIVIATEDAGEGLFARMEEEDDIAADHIDANGVVRQEDQDIAGVACVVGDITVEDAAILEDDDREIHTP
jgi:hypothetical protein